MNKHHPQALLDSPKLEVKKQNYQIPTLEQHNFLSLTGVGLSIGGSVVPGSLELVVQNPFELQELQ
jgi:hypothetical protein